MQYREVHPSNRALAPYLRFFWTLSSVTSLPVPQLIVPDGCPEMIFHFGDRFLLHCATGSVVQPRAFVFGQIERAIVIEACGSNVDILGVRFQPAGLSAFTPMPCSEFTGRMVECRDLWAEEPQFVDGVDRVATLERFLLQRLRPRPEPWREDLSSRQNRRRFADSVGLSPKRMERIQRLQAAMSGLRLGGLAEAALAAGYYDQAHFTREFREFTGQTPAQFRREPHAFSDFFTQQMDVRNVQETGPHDGAE